jgi:hypothetical protein
MAIDRTFTVRWGNYPMAIGHNIKAASAAGAGGKQALAIALSTASGSSIRGILGKKGGPGSRSESRVAYMKGLAGKTYRPVKPLRQAAFKAGSLARSGARPVFHYPGVAPFGPGMKPYGSGVRPTPAATSLDRGSGGREYKRDAQGRFAA